MYRETPQKIFTILTFRREARLPIFTSAGFAWGCDGRGIWEDGGEVNYYIAIGNQQRGPFARNELLAQGLTAQTLVWAEGMPQWQPAGSVPELAELLRRAPAQAVPPINPQYSYAAAAASFGSSRISDANSKKVAAGLLGIFLGAFGIHKFILGMNGAGIIMVLCTLTCVGYPIMHVIGVIEGIIYLTKTDQEFYDLYMVNKQAWF